MPEPLRILKCSNITFEFAPLVTNDVESIGVSRNDILACIAGRPTEEDDF